MQPTQPSLVAPAPATTTPPPAAPPPAAPPPAGPSWRGIAGAASLGAAVAFTALGYYATTQVMNAREDPAFARHREMVPTGTDACEDAQRGKQVPGGIDAGVLGSWCSRVHTFEALQIVFYALGAASAGAGAYFLLTRDAQPARAQGLRPAFGPGGASLAWTAAF